MKKLNLMLILLILLFVCFGTGIFAIQAMGQGAGKSTNVTQNQTDEADLIVAARKVQIQEEVRKDIVAAGRDVIVSGEVMGYLIAAGRNITASAPIGNDLYAAGENINLNAPVADNAVIAGRNIYLQPGAVVQHDAMIAGRSIDVNGKIMQDLKLAAGEARLASEVGGSVDARVAKLVLLPGALVRGNLIVHSPQAPEISPQAQVLGRIEHIPTARERWWVDWLRQFVFSFLALSVLGIAAVLLSQPWTNRVTTMIAEKPGISLIAGVAGLILIPLIGVLFLITVIGIPLAFITLALYLIALLLSGVFASWLVGGWLLKRFNRPDASRWARIVVGALVVSFCASLPWIGGLVLLVVLVAGLGALLLERRDFLLRRAPQQSA
jgi:hypothetical protein